MEGVQVRGRALINELEMSTRHGRGFRDAKGADHTWSPFVAAFVYILSVSPSLIGAGVDRVNI